MLFDPGCADCGCGPAPTGCTLTMRLNSSDVGTLCGPATSGITVSAYDSSMTFLGSAVTGSGVGWFAGEARIVVPFGTTPNWVISSRHPTLRTFVTGCGFWTWNDCTGFTWS
ncbi:hypothetical protein VT85_26725 (plasmid) [Planctomyces sp. SH-PL62]|nr:hypothetical protein VT85_26725 [Planctomyces sp. SH-PL62]